MKFWKIIFIVPDSNQSEFLTCIPSCFKSIINMAVLQITLMEEKRKNSKYDSYFELKQAYTGLPGQLVNCCLLLFPV